MKTIEERLWDYIDGTSSAEEKNSVEQLMLHSPEVKKLHEEFRTLHQQLMTEELEEPSLRFTQNVMERVALEPKPSPLKTKVDKRIINGIGGFFLVTILILIIVAFTQMNWNVSGTSFQLPQYDFTSVFNSPLWNWFWIVDGVMGLFLLDKFLRAGLSK